MNIEALSAMTFAEARAAVDAIRRDVDDLINRIRDLWVRRAWLALGYDSWEELCLAEFPHRSLPCDERRATAVSLRETGMSARAIAAATGVHHTTILADLQVVENSPPVAVIGSDGKTYPTTTGNHVSTIRELAAAGFSAAAIGEQLGITASRVWTIAKEAGIAVGKRSRAARAERIERTRLLAGEGATSQQIADELGVDANVIRRYARDSNIDIPADTVTMVRTMDSARIVTAAIDVLDGIDTMFGHIDYGTLPSDDVTGWVDVLDASIRSLTTLRKRLKELTQP